MTSFWKIHLGPEDATPSVRRKIKHLPYLYTVADGEKFDQINQLLYNRYQKNYYLTFTEYFWNNDIQAMDRHLWFALKEPMDDELKMILKLI
jgi:hypothetical protein